MRRRHCLPFLIALATPAQAAQTAPATSWYRLVMHTGQAIGYRTQTAAETAGGREITSIQQIDLQEPGDPVTRAESQSIFREDAQGRTQWMSDYSQTGRSWTRTVATIEPRRAIVVRTTRTGEHRTVVPLPAGVRFDGGAGLIRGWNRAGRLDFSAFNLEGMAVERMTIEVAPDQGAALPGTAVLLRKRYDGDQLRAITRLTIDGTGRIIATTQPMFGTFIRVEPVDRDTALAPHPPFQAVASMMIKSPMRIGTSALNAHIRYRFAFADGMAFTPPQTGEQRVTSDPGGITLDICTTCGPGLPTDADTLANALRPTHWLQSDDRRIRSIAATVRAAGTAQRKMERLATLTMTYITRLDFTGHYSALETIERGAGDCTEAAVLLAALGRAAGIPTKVVNGLVYSRASYHGVSNAFLPHSWVLAYVEGKWISFDAALLAFDSTHIALTVGDGDARSISAAAQLGSLLVWESMAEVRTR